jgi:hypothetical protein
VLGSILASGYRGGMDGAPAAAHESLAGALAVAARTGNHDLAATAQQAFVNGMHSAVVIAAVIAFAGALVALVFLPARETAPALVPELAAA